MVSNRYPPRIQKVCQLSFTGINRLLDIGCGNGDFALLLGESYHVSELFGTDISNKAIVLARLSGVNAVCVDVDHDVLPYPDQHFGMVFTGEIIEHLLYPDLLLNEVYRVLEPSGHLIVTVPNLASWYNRLQLFFGYQPYGIPASHVHRGAGALWSRARSNMVYGSSYSPATGLAEGFPYHIRFYTARAVSDLLWLHGFREIKKIGAATDDVVFKMPGLIQRLVMIADTFISNSISSLASRSIIIGEKPDVE